MDLENFAYIMLFKKILSSTTVFYSDFIAVFYGEIMEQKTPKIHHNTKKSSFCKIVSVKIWEIFGEIMVKKVNAIISPFYSVIFSMCFIRKRLKFTLESPVYNQFWELKIAVNLKILAKPLVFSVNITLKSSKIMEQENCHFSSW